MDSNSYLNLNETQEELINLALARCIAFLDFNDESSLIHKTELAQLRLVIEDKLTHLKQSSEAQTKPNILITCTYCGAQCLRSKWLSHIKEKCRYDLHKGLTHGGLKKSAYLIDADGLKCLLCNFATCKINHDASFIHNLLSLGNSDFNYDTIYCSLCRHLIPYHLCFHHFTSIQHQLLLRKSSEWYTEGIKYLAFHSVVFCIKCDVDLQTEVGLHHQTHHSKERLGLKQLSSDLVWCCHCNKTMTCGVFTFHTFETCPKSIHSYYCQICQTFVCGKDSFDDHVKECKSEVPRNKESTEITSLSSTTEIISNIRSSEYVECFYCRSKCLKMELGDHVRYSCTSIFDASGEFNPTFKCSSGKSMYNYLLTSEILCNICGKSSKTLNWIQIHTLTHSNNYDDNDHHTIYCEICQENIPNDFNILIGHAESRTHERLKIMLVNVEKHGLTNLVIRPPNYETLMCLICRENICFDDIQVHILEHMENLSAFYDNYLNLAWCSLCDSFCKHSNISSHCGKCPKNMQNFFCQNCSLTVIGHSNFLKHMTKCYANESNVEPSPSNGLEESNDVDSESSDDESPLITCYSCGTAVKNIRDHISARCQNPYNQIAILAGKISVYKLAPKTLECRACPDTRIKISEKNDHDDSLDHQANLQDDIQIDDTTIFCQTCEEYMPNTNGAIFAHQKGARHRKLGGMWKFGKENNIEFVIVKGGVKCLICKRIKKRKFCLHKDQGDTVWCSFCDLTFDIVDYSDHSKDCTKSLLIYFCQLCNKSLLGQDNFETHLNKCVNKLTFKRFTVAIPSATYVKTISPEVDVTDCLSTVTTPMRYSPKSLSQNKPVTSPENIPTYTSARMPVERFTPTTSTSILSDTRYVSITTSCSSALMPNTSGTRQRTISPVTTSTTKPSSNNDTNTTSFPKFSAAYASTSHLPDATGVSSLSSWPRTAKASTPFSLHSSIPDSSDPVILSRVPSSTAYAVPSTTTTPSYNSNANTNLSIYSGAVTSSSYAPHATEAGPASGSSTTPKTSTPSPFSLYSSIPASSDPVLLSRVPSSTAYAVPTKTATPSYNCNANTNLSIYSDAVTPSSYAPHATGAGPVSGSSHTPKTSIPSPISLYSCIPASSSAELFPRNPSTSATTHALSDAQNFAGSVAGKPNTIIILPRRATGLAPPVPARTRTPSSARSTNSSLNVPNATSTAPKASIFSPIQGSSSPPNTNATITLATSTSTLKSSTINVSSSSPKSNKKNKCLLM